MTTTVIKEALPLKLIGKKDSAVLLIHGYTGYAGEYYELAESINKEGFTVSLPRLPGHGTNRRDFLKTGWRDWLNHIQNAYLDLKAEYKDVSVVGLSMGGVLSLILASRFNVKKIVLMAPAMAVHSKSFYLTPIIKFFKKEMKKDWSPDEGDNENIRKLGKEYWSVTLPSQLSHLYKLMRIAKKGLSKVKCPTLLMLSEIDDSVPLKAGDIIERGFQNVALEKVILKESPHVIVSGKEKDMIISKVVKWLKEGEE